MLPEVNAMVTEGVSPNNPTHHYLTSCMIMTASDLSDQTKDWVNAKKIAELVYNEFFTQVTNIGMISNFATGSLSSLFYHCYQI